MKKGLKRFLALGLTTVLTVGALAGCGTKSDSGKSGSAGGTSAAGSASGVVLNDGGTYPVVKEGKLELSVFTMSMPNVQDFATNDFTKFLEEKTGIHINL